MQRPSLGVYRSQGRNEVLLRDLIRKHPALDSVAARSSGVTDEYILQAYDNGIIEEVDSMIISGIKKTADQMRLDNSIFTVPWVSDERIVEAYFKGELEELEAEIRHILRERGQSSPPHLGKYLGILPGEISSKILSKIPVAKDTPLYNRDIFEASREARKGQLFYMHRVSDELPEGINLSLAPSGTDWKVVLREVEKIKDFVGLLNINLKDEDIVLVFRSAVALALPSMVAILDGIGGNVLYLQTYKNDNPESMWGTLSKMIAEGEDPYHRVIKYYLKRMIENGQTMKLKHNMVMGGIDLNPWDQICTTNDTEIVDMVRLVCSNVNEKDLNDGIFGNFILSVMFYLEGRLKVDDIYDHVNYFIIDALPGFMAGHLNTNVLSVPHPKHTVDQICFGLLEIRVNDLYPGTLSERGETVEFFRQLTVAACPQSILYCMEEMEIDLTVDMRIEILGGLSMSSIGFHDPMSNKKDITKKNEALLTDPTHFYLVDLKKAIDIVAEGVPTVDRKRIAEDMRSNGETIIPRMILNR